MRFCNMELAESNMKQTVRLRDMAEINQYRKELRDKIIAYAMKEFHQRGVKAVKMDEISRGLRVSKRTVYEIFGDKEELLLAGMKIERAEYKARVEQYALTHARNVTKVSQVKIHKRDLT